MTPKEKAEELIWRYNFTPCMTELQVKQCALIVVDELIEQCEDANFGGFGLYWQAVKQEIEKL